MAKQVATYIIEVKPTIEPETFNIRYQIVDGDLSKWGQLNDYIIDPTDTVEESGDKIVAAIKAKEGIVD